MEADGGSRLVLGIDVGTSSVKAVLLDVRSGDVVDSQSRDTRAAVQSECGPQIQRTDPTINNGTDESSHVNATPVKRPNPLARICKKRKTKESEKIAGTVSNPPFGPGSVMRGSAYRVSAKGSFSRRTNMALMQCHLPFAASPTHATAREIVMPPREGEEREKTIVDVVEIAPGSPSSGSGSNILLGHEEKDISPVKLEIAELSQKEIEMEINQDAPDSVCAAPSATESEGIPSNANEEDENAPPAVIERLSDDPPALLVKFPEHCLG